MRTHLEPKVFLNGLTGGAIAGASMGFVDGYLRKPIVAKNWVPSAIAAGSTLGAVISGTYLGDSLLKKGNGNIEKSASIMGRLGEASSRMLDGAVLGWIDGASRNLLTSTKAAKNELYKLNKINMAKGVAGPDINMDQASLAAKKAIWNAVYVGGEMGSASGAFNGIVRGFVYGPKKIVKPIDKIKAQIPAIAYGSAALAGTTAGGIYGSNLYLKRIHKDQ